MKVKVISLPYIFKVLYVLCCTRPRYQVSVYRTTGPLVCSSVSVAEWPPFLEIAAHSVDHMFSLYFVFVILVISRFGYEGCIWVMIASVPDLCIGFLLFETSFAHIMRKFGQKFISMLLAFGQKKESLKSDQLELGDSVFMPIECFL